MTSLTFSSVPTGTAATTRHERGLHLIHFRGDAARAPEVMQALPDLGWDVDLTGKPTLPPAEVFRIVSKVARLPLGAADTLRIFGDFPQLEEVARIWELIMQHFTFTGEAMPWPVFVAELQAAKGRCAAGDFTLPGDKFVAYDTLDDHSLWSREQHAVDEEALISADQVVQRQANFNHRVEAYNRLAASYNAALVADPRPDPLPSLPTKPTLESTPLPPPARAPTAPPPFSSVAAYGRHVARFAELRWSHMLARDGGCAEIGEFLWYANDWLCAESAFSADRPLFDALEAVHAAIPASAVARAAVDLTRFGRGWAATALPATLQTWERQGVPRLVALTDRLESPGTPPARLLAERWHTAITTQVAAQALLGHEPDARIAIDLLRDTATVVGVHIDGEPTERHLRLVNGELADSYSLILSWKYPPRPAPPDGTSAPTPQTPVPADALVRELTRHREADQLARDVAPRHASAQYTGGWACGGSGGDSHGPGQGPIPSHAKEMQAFLAAELRCPEFLAMERDVLAPLITGGDAVQAIMIALTGSSTTNPKARPRAIFHQLVHGHIDSVVARPELGELVRKRGLAAVAVTRAAAATLVPGGEVDLRTPLAHMPLTEAWKHLKASRQDEVGDAWASLNIEDMVNAPIARKINPRYVHQPVPPKQRYATVDSLSSVLEPGAAIFALLGFEDSPRDSWRVAISEAKRFLVPHKSNPNAGGVTRRFVISLLREAYGALHASRYSSDVRRHPPRQFIQPGSQAVNEFAAAQKLFALECERSQQEYEVRGPADSDDEGGHGERLSPRRGLDGGPLERRRGGDAAHAVRDRNVAWLDGRARSPSPGGPPDTGSRILEDRHTLTRLDTGEKWRLSAAADNLRSLGAPPELCVRWAILRSCTGLTEPEKCPYLDCSSHLHRAVSGFRASAFRVDSAGTNAEHNRRAAGRERSPARVGSTYDERGRGASRDDRRSRSRSAERSPRRESEPRGAERRSASRSPARNRPAGGTGGTAAPAAAKSAAKPAKVTR